MDDKERWGKVGKGRGMSRNVDESKGRERGVRWRLVVILPFVKIILE